MIQISLAAARVNADLTQEEAAKKVGVTAKTLRGYEQGKSVAPPRIFKQMARVYEFPEELIRLPIVEDGMYDADEKILN
ncbi:helix-turn-helix domain-containing protein [Cohnella sp.]|uniref:helix-turn-helix domain-containing protein n=1 Tax=Cohnella sp. TaxID=1883426 RepID=UPI003703AAF5